MADNSGATAKAFAAQARARRKLRRRAGAVILAVLVVVAAAVAIVIVRAEPANAQYRLAAASTGSVNQQVQQPGTVANATTNSAAFAVAGTVAAVGVKVGQTVNAGQQLASLDPADLEQSLTNASTTLQPPHRRAEPVGMADSIPAVAAERRPAPPARRALAARTARQHRHPPVTRAARAPS
ncbi:MAG: biotin/lipoyl-binding protein [Nakamurella sp.]